MGTSGWTYADWAGRFYPEDVRGSDRLLHYARLFNSVEVNATFYRLPTTAMVQAWSRLPRTFHLAAKGPRLVTHVRRLRDCDRETGLFLERIRAVPTLRVVLWQLPPSLPPDPERLARFLARLPQDIRHAVEFRHPGWWDEDVAGVLRRHHAAFVAVSHPRLPDEIRDTTDFLYVRFHGLGKDLYRHDYSRAELMSWVRRLRRHAGARRLYAFFNNDFGAHAVKNAIVFRDLLNRPVRPGGARR